MGNKKVAVNGDKEPT